MGKDSRSLLMAAASKKGQQVLIAVLFIAMGIMGFSSGEGSGARFAQEIASMTGADSELMLYIVSTLELICGIAIAAQLFVKGIPVKVSKTALAVVLVFWLAMIIILDLLTIDLGSFDGSDWFIWIEAVVLHLIVLASILQIQE